MENTGCSLSYRACPWSARAHGRGAQGRWNRAFPVGMGCTAVVFWPSWRRSWCAGVERGGAFRQHALPLWSWGVDGVGLGLLGDAISMWFALVVTGVGLLIHIYSAAYMADDPSYPGFSRSSTTSSSP